MNYAPSYAQSQAFLHVDGQYSFAYDAFMSDTTELVRRIRAHGLTQTEIARRTGIPQPRLSRWENGDAPVGADDALKLHRLDAELGDPPPRADQPPAAQAA
jgi:Helix-turn-helix